MKNTTKAIQAIIKRSFAFSIVLGLRILMPAASGDDCLPCKGTEPAFDLITAGNSDCPSNVPDCDYQNCWLVAMEEDSRCAPVDPTEASGKTDCEQVDSPKRFMTILGSCWPQTCACLLTPNVQYGNVPGETVKRATLSGSDCGVGNG